MRVRRWAMLLAAASVSSAAQAVPFVVELTVPDVSGYAFVDGPGKPGTAFKAPQLVLRATGDTANVIQRSPAGDGVRYHVLAVSVDIAGVGKGTALGGDVALVVGEAGVDLTSPSYFTFFDMGVHAEIALPAGYRLQASVGPLSGSVFTYHWGPTSGMIPFTLDGGLQGTVAGGSSGGVLQVTIGGDAPNPVAARTYVDLAKFQKATGPNRIATFEEGTGAASGGVTFGEGQLQVVERVTETSSLESRSHAYWFRDQGSPSRFALNSTGSPLVPAQGFDATFPEDVLAAGFLFNCYECRPYAPNVAWTTFDAAGTPMESGTLIVPQVTETIVKQPRAAFIGLTTTRPFRKLSIARPAPIPGGVSPWVIDDLRFATTLPAIEYRHAAFDHYFVTSIADETEKLDDGRLAGWKRTGLQFNAGAAGAAGTRPVCRLFSASFAPKSSHFYSSDIAECALRKADPHWRFEGTVFSLSLADAGGGCAANATPLFRLYNNGQGGAPNHRYTTSLAARQSMIDAGWISEGSGGLGEIGCVLK